MFLSSHHDIHLGSWFIQFIYFLFTIIANLCIAIPLTRRSIFGLGYVIQHKNPGYLKGRRKRAEIIIFYGLVQKMRIASFILHTCDVVLAVVLPHYARS